MWAKIARYVQAPMGAYPGHYGIIIILSFVLEASVQLKLIQ